MPGASRACEGVELEGDVGGIAAGPKISALGGDTSVMLEDREPAAHVRRDGVAQRTGPGVKLDRGGCEKTAAREGPALVVGDPRVDYGHQTRPARLLVSHRRPHLASEVLDRGLERRELELLAAAEQTEQAALAHPGLLGEKTESQALQPLDGGAPNGAVGDLGASPGDGGSGATWHIL